MTPLPVDEASISEMELAFGRRTAVRHYWRNAGSSRGVFSRRQELRMLLSNVGRTPTWDWIVCTTDVDESRWTQAGGRAEQGLIVEINGPYRVRPQLTPRSAIRNVGSLTWPYMAPASDVHTLDLATRIQYAWLTRGLIFRDLRLVVPDLSVRRYW